MEKVRIKKFLFFILMAVMWVPLLNTVFRFSTENKLGGAYNPILKPAFTQKDWLEGVYQEQAEKYLNDTMGFHRSLVRLNNQFNYSMFQRTDIYREVGKDGYLFETDYFKALQGTDYLGEDSIHKLVSMTRFVADTLGKQGIHLIFVLAPSKARFMPENLPDHVQRLPKVVCNMDIFKKEFAAQGIPFTDFNSWLISMKNKSPYPLYPKTGVHWGHYGAALAMDSLMRFMEKIEGKDMPELTIESVEQPDTLRSPDNDIVEAMNLIWEPPYYPMTYPVFKVNDDTTKFRPNVITVGDSYYWQLYGTGVTGKLFSGNQFWFYNRWIYKGIVESTADDLFVQDEIEAQDFIILFYTEPQLAVYSSDFIQHAYLIYTDSAFAANDIPITEAEIEKMMDNIIQTPEWAASVQDKARAANVPFMTQVRTDAIYVIKENRKQKKK